MNVLVYFPCLTDFAEILRYTSDGVNRSAGIETHSGTKLGASGELLE